MTRLYEVKYRYQGSTKPYSEMVRAKSYSDAVMKAGIGKGEELLAVKEAS